MKYNTPKCVLAGGAKSDIRGKKGWWAIGLITHSTADYKGKFLGLGSAQSTWRDPSFLTT